MTQWKNTCLPCESSWIWPSPSFPKFTFFLKKFLKQKAENCNYFSKKLLMSFLPSVSVLNTPAEEGKASLSSTGRSLKLDCRLQRIRLCSQGIPWILWSLNQTLPVLSRSKPPRQTAYTERLFQSRIMVTDTNHFPVPPFHSFSFVKT